MFTEIENKKADIIEDSIDMEDSIDLFELGDTKFIPMSEDNVELKAEKFNISKILIEEAPIEDIVMEYYK